MREHRRDRRGNDLVGAGGHSDRGRDAEEEQQRRDEEPAADAEHPRQEADDGSEPEQDEKVDRHLGDGKVELHRPTLRGGRCLGNGRVRNRSGSVTILRARQGAMQRADCRPGLREPLRESPGRHRASPLRTVVVILQGGASDYAQFRPGFAASMFRSGPSGKTINMLAIDLAKGSFPVCSVAAGGAVRTRVLSRARLTRLLAGQPACAVAMKPAPRRITGAGWRRSTAMRFGSSRQPAKSRSASARRTTARTAEAIAEAAMRPTMRFVAIRSAETPGRAVAFRTHQCLVRQRTQRIKALPTSRRVRAGGAGGPASL